MTAAAVLVAFGIGCLIALLGILWKWGRERRKEPPPDDDDLSGWGV